MAEITSPPQAAPAHGVHTPVGPWGLTYLHYGLLIAVYLLRSLFPSLPAILSPLNTSPTPPPQVAPAPAPAPVAPAPQPAPTPPAITIPIPPIFQPTPPKPPLPKPMHKTKQEVVQAIVWIGNCTATLLAPVTDPPQVPVLSAAHCVSRVGQTIGVKLHDGRRYKAKVVAMDHYADCALAVIDTAEQLPYAILAADVPDPGTKVWHAGGGVNVPWNVVSGTIRVYPFHGDRVGYRISFSPGDSGSGIFTYEKNELVGTCHGSVDGIADGASVVACRRMIDRWMRQRVAAPGPGGAGPTCPICPRRSDLYVRYQACVVEEIPGRAAASRPNQV